MVKTQDDFYEEFFKWLDEFGPVTIPGVGDVPEAKVPLSDVMTGSYELGLYCDKLFEEWLRENYENTD